MRERVEVKGLPAVTIADAEQWVLLDDDCPAH